MPLPEDAQELRSLVAVKELHIAECEARIRDLEQTNDRLREVNQHAAGIAHQKATADGDVRVAELEAKVRAADRMADEIAALVTRGKLSTRTPVTDALEDYRSPPQSPRSDRIAALEKQATAQVDDAKKVADAPYNHEEAELFAHLKKDESNLARCYLDLLAASRANLEEQVAELQRSFDMRYAADMRAIKRWQEAHPDRDHVWPDRADLLIWLLERLDHCQGIIDAKSNELTGLLTTYQDRTAEADRLRVRCDALEAMLVEVRKRIFVILPGYREETIDQCMAIVTANGGRSVHDIVEAMRTLRGRT